MPSTNPKYSAESAEKDNKKKGQQIVVCEKEFILGLLFINHCITFHTNNSKPPLANPVCISMQNDR